MKPRVPRTRYPLGRAGYRQTRQPGGTLPGLAHLLQDSPEERLATPQEECSRCSGSASRGSISGCQEASQTLAKIPLRELSLSGEPHAASLPGKHGEPE